MSSRRISLILYFRRNALSSRDLKPGRQSPHARTRAAFTNVLPPPVFCQAASPCHVGAGHFISRGGLCILSRPRPAHHFRDSVQGRKGNTLAGSGSALRPSPHVGSCYLGCDPSASCIHSSSLNSRLLRSFSKLQAVPSGSNASMLSASRAAR